MTNPFDRIQAAPHISKRVEMPLDAILSTALKLEDRYYQNKATMDKLGIFANNLELFKDDEFLKNQALTEVDKTIEAISANENAYENSTSVVQGLANKFASDPRLKVAMENFQKSKQWEDWASKQRAEGKYVHDFGQGSPFRTVNEDGSLNYWQNKNEVLLNYSDKMSEIWQGMLKGEAWVGDIDPKDLSPDNPFIKVARGQGVTLSQVDRKKAAAYEHYLQTDEGRQHARYLESIGEDPEAVIYSQLENIGNGKTYLQDHSSYMNNPEYLNSYQRYQMAKDKAEAGKKESKPYIVSDGRSSATVYGKTLDELAGSVSKSSGTAKRRALHAQQKVLNAFMNAHPTVKAATQKKYEELSQKYGYDNVKMIAQALGLEPGGDPTGGKGMMEYLGLASSLSGTQTVPSARGTFVVPKTEVPEKHEVNGKEMTIEERNNIFSAFKELRKFKRTEIDDVFEDALAGELTLTDKVMTPENKKDLTEIDAQIKRTDPDDFNWLPLTDKEDATEVPENMNSLIFNGITPGDGDTPIEMEVLDTKTGVVYRAVSKNPQAGDLIDYITSFYDGGEAMSLDYKYSNFEIPEEGINGVRIEPLDGGRYQMDKTNEQYLEAILEAYGDNAAEQYQSAAIDIYRNYGIPDSLIQVYFTSPEDLSAEKREMLDSILSKNYTGSKGQVIENAQIF